jgi:hypothetical protein
MYTMPTLNGLLESMRGECNCSPPEIYMFDDSSIRHPEHGDSVEKIPSDSMIYTHSGRSCESNRSVNKKKRQCKMDKRELPIQITVPKSEYIPYCDDLVRIVTIQFVIQFMMMPAERPRHRLSRIGPLYFGRRQYVLVD